MRRRDVSAEAEIEIFEAGLRYERKRDRMPVPPMKLPNADLAWVDRRKVVEYLLNAAHPENGGKAQFFLSLGYVPESADELMRALRDIAAAWDVVVTSATPYGQKFVVDGPLPGHTGTGRTRTVRTVWAIDQSSEYPRFVTAYPRGK